MDIGHGALINFLALSRNPYPGRGIVMGRAPDGTAVQIYWLMGRSEGSRNRILEPVPDKHGWIRTCIADPTKYTGDPSLLIYNAMAEEQGTYVVSNGAQTDLVIQDGMIGLKNGDWRYEPDGPNFTPRITGRFQIPGRTLTTRLVMLRKSPFGDERECFDYAYDGVAPGYGYCITTYDGDDDPLPSFHGEPLIMPINGSDPTAICAEFWAVLDDTNRVAIVVKLIPPDRPSEIAVFNRYATG